MRTLSWKPGTAVPCSWKIMFSGSETARRPSGRPPPRALLLRPATPPRLLQLQVCPREPSSQLRTSAPSAPASPPSGPPRRPAMSPEPKPPAAPASSSPDRIPKPPASHECERGLGGQPPAPHRFRAAPLHRPQLPLSMQAVYTRSPSRLRSRRAKPRAAELPAGRPGVRPSRPARPLGGEGPGEREDMAARQEARCTDAVGACGQRRPALFCCSAALAAGKCVPRRLSAAKNCGPAGRSREVRQVEVDVPVPRAVVAHGDVPAHPVHQERQLLALRRRPQARRVRRGPGTGRPRARLRLLRLGRRPPRRRRRWRRPTRARSRRARHRGQRRRHRPSRHWRHARRQLHPPRREHLGNCRPLRRLRSPEHCGGGGGEGNPAPALGARVARQARRRREKRAWEARRARVWAAGAPGQKDGFAGAVGRQVEWLARVSNGASKST